VWLEISIYIM